MGTSETVQREKLGRLVREISANPFQQERVAGLGAEWSLDDFRAKVALTTKAEVAADFEKHPPYGTNLTYPLKRYTRFCQTSGTMARPLPILDTAESWKWMLGNWRRVYDEAGVQAGERIYFAFSFGPFLGFWTAFEAATERECMCIPGGGLGSMARLRAMQENAAEVLCCTPTYALHLAETANREGIDLGAFSIRKVIVAGEAGGSVGSVRKRIEAAWIGSRVIDHYGMTEVGPVAYQQSDEPDTLRVMEESYFAEVIDPVSEMNVGHGVVGELVLTPLGRTAWPLLRYRTGDLVKRREGDGFRLEGGILGRSDDMVIVRGVNIFPSAIDAAVRSVESISEYRVTVSRAGELAELEIEVESSDEGAVRQLERVLSDTFALRIPVERVLAGSLPRFEFKSKRFQRRS